MNTFRPHYINIFAVLLFIPLFIYQAASNVFRHAHYLIPIALSLLTFILLAKWLSKHPQSISLTADQLVITYPFTSSKLIFKNNQIKGLSFFFAEDDQEFTKSKVLALITQEGGEFTLSRHFFFNFQSFETA